MLDIDASFHSGHCHSSCVLQAFFIVTLIIICVLAILWYIYVKIYEQDEWTIARLNTLLSEDQRNNLSHIEQSTTRHIALQEV